MFSMAHRLARAPKWRRHFDSYQLAFSEAVVTLKHVRPLLRDRFLERFVEPELPHPALRTSVRTRRRWLTVTARRVS